MRQIWALGLAVLLTAMSWSLNWIPIIAPSADAGLSTAISSLWFAAIAPTAQAAAQSTDAESLFRAAYANRYTWNENFPGYQAEVKVQSGETEYSGLAELMPDFGVVVKNIADQTAQQIIAAQLQMSATHLQRVEFDQLHQQHQFELTGFDTGGAAQIQEIGDSADSHYKVKDQQIVQVNRKLGEVAVEVNTLAVQQTPEGYLTNHFQVIFRNPETGQVIEQDDIQDDYSNISGYYVLTKREIRTGADHPSNHPLVDTTVQFDHIQLKKA